MVPAGTVSAIGGSTDSGNIPHDGVRFENIVPGQYRIWTTENQNAYNVTVSSGSMGITSFHSGGSMSVKMVSTTGGPSYTSPVADVASSPAC